MSPQAKFNVGFQPPAGRKEQASDVDCGQCGQPVPDGTACIVVNFHAAGFHQMFCPEHIPPNTRPWRPQ